MKTFSNTIKDIIIDRLDNENIVVDVTEVVKNNVTLTGLTIRDTNESIAPVIYLDSYFSDYLNDEESIEDVVTDILGVYEKSLTNRPMVDDVTDTVLDYNKAKHKFMVCCVGIKGNEELLNSIPHLVVCDIAMYVRVEIHKDRNGVSSVKVNNEIFEGYHTSKETFFADAFENMRKEYPYECKDMIDIVMGENIPDFIRDSMEEHRGEMFVIQTESKSYGAFYGFDTVCLDEISYLIGEEKFYVLPSSINEVIVIPYSKVDDESRLTSIVGEVNNEMVPCDEILSYSAYLYDNNTREITIAKVTEIA